MEQQAINQAIDLFQIRFGITPQESRYPVIDIYEKQHAYLYAETEEAIAAYKTHQNIIRWIMCFLFMAAGCQHNTPFLCGRQISKT